jgi:translation initiation factor 2A
LQAFKGPSSDHIEDPKEHTKTSVTLIKDVVDSIKDVRSSPQYSPDGALLCIIKELGQPIALHNTITGELVGEIPCFDASYVEFSPQGSYMVTWSKPVKGTADEGSEGNLKIWQLSSLQLVAAYSQKTFKKETIQFTADESLCFRIVSNEIHILKGDNIAGGIISKVYHKGLSQFRITPTSIPITTIAVFNADMKGNPAKVTLYSYSPSKVVMSVLDWVCVFKR